MATAVYTSVKFSFATLAKAPAPRASPLPWWRFVYTTIQWLGGAALGWVGATAAVPVALVKALYPPPVADQVVEQPAAPPHDYSSGFDTTGNDGDGQGDARGY